MENEQEKMKIQKIENGVVIDHIPSNKGMKVLALLGVDEKFPGTVSMVMHTKSSRLGHKDIIKIEDKQLADREINKLALIAPQATVNFVKNYQVVRKQVMGIPDAFEDVIRCPNSKCITANEGKPRLDVEQKSPLRVRCHYCEKVYTRDELLELSSFTA